jgi:hypothetical protein
VPEKADADVAADEEGTLVSLEHLGHQRRCRRLSA